MRIKIKWLIGAVVLSLALIFNACEAPDQPEYGADHPDPNPSGKPAATLSTINPTTGYFAETVTITGTNFNTDPTKTLVKFGGKVAEIVNLSSTEITVITPGIIGDSVAVQVAVAGSEYWSNSLGFVFKDLPDNPEVTVIDEEIKWPNGVAVDADENVYIGSAADGLIFKITPAGDKSQFAEVPVNGAIHFGPEGYLYVCEQGEGKIQRISPDGGTIEDVVEVGDPIDFDWDADHTMYIVSNWSGISKFDGSEVTELVSLDNPKVIRIYEDMLYISDIWNGTIWTFDMTVDGLDNQTAVYEGGSPSCFDMASNGLMILAEAWETSLFTMFQDGSMGPVMYEEELETPMRYMLWMGKSIYVVYPGWGDVGKTLKVNIGLEQAPRYGKQ